VVEEQPSDVLRFEIRSFTRPSDLVDFIGMRTFGKIAQKATWHSVVQSLVERSGGEAPDGVQEESSTLEGQDAEDVEKWVEELVMAQKREEAPRPSDASPSSGGSSSSGSSGGGSPGRPAV
jgi:hypothetical protein